MVDIHDPAFWVTVAFVIVVGLLIKKLVPMVRTGLDKRAVEIREELDRAQSLREEAQAVLAQYQKKQRESLKEADEIIQKANLEARRITKDAETQVEEALKKRTKLALDKIEQAERHALAEVQAKLVDITVAAAREIVTEKLDTKARDEMVAAAVQDIEQKLH